jgi:hypothetical protein
MGAICSPERRFELDLHGTKFQKASVNLPHFFHADQQKTPTKTHYPYIEGSTMKKDAASFSET